MHYGSGPLNKYEYACTRGRQPGLPAAAAAGRRRLRGVRRTRPRDGAACAAKRNHSALDRRGARRQRAARQDRPVRASCADVAETYPRRGHDGADLRSARRPRRRCSRACKLLRQRGHDVLVFHVLDDDELDFPFTGPTRFEGLETARPLELQSAGAARGLPGRRCSASWTKSAAAVPSNSVDYALLRTSQPLDAALATFLSNRITVT